MRILVYLIPLKALLFPHDLPSSRQLIGGQFPVVILLYSVCDD